MANSKIPTEDDPDKYVCEECGAVHDGEDDTYELLGRREMMDDALDGIEHPAMELLLISSIAGEFLAKFPAEARDAIRTALIEAIDDEATAAVIAQCDA